jgi:hypothetical protein
LEEWDAKNLMSQQRNFFAHRAGIHRQGGEWIL